MRDRPHLPSPDLDLSNLTRRQAEVFEHLSGPALTGAAAEDPLALHRSAAAALVDEAAE